MYEEGMVHFGKNMPMEEEFFVVVAGGQVGVVDYDEVRHIINSIIVIVSYAISHYILFFAISRMAHHI